jgi:hypothetical protein
VICVLYKTEAPNTKGVFIGGPLVVTTDAELWIDKVEYILGQRFYVLERFDVVKIINSLLSTFI